MKFAAIADVHGNLIALEAVLADIATLCITEIVNLGDHVSGPLQPLHTADLLSERGMPSIQGDQDRRLVELSLSGPDASRRLDYRQLHRKHFDWMASLPPTMVYRDNVFMCHGSPKNNTAYWLDRVADDGSIQATKIEEVEAEETDYCNNIIKLRTFDLTAIRLPPFCKRHQRLLIGRWIEAKN